MIRSDDGGGTRLEKLQNCDETELTGDMVVVNARKYEGQQSSLKSNSCSSYKGANGVANMAQEDYDPGWDTLPSVILQEIFLYLSQENRIIASQVCRNWRCALFHPSFWKKITFALRDEDSISWAKFLLDYFGLSVQDVTIRCETPVHALKETLILLKKLSNNRQLKKLYLESSVNTFDWPVDDLDTKEDNNKLKASLIKCIIKIIETTNHLETLSLGCIEELTTSADIILESLILHHAKNLTHLSLASVKEDPEQYNYLKLDDNIFKSFVKLSVLSVDYDFVSDSFLKAVNNGSMERLVIHVHGWNGNCSGTTNEAWQIFVQNNPKCQLRLNLIHSYNGVKVLDTEILRPAMPLTHLKVLFCETINHQALNLLSSWYQHTLKSFILIDSMDHSSDLPSTIDPFDPLSPDPLVLLAWQCAKLSDLIFIGHKYILENLLAIARLRGNTLNSLVFAESNIVPENESWVAAEAITLEIRDIMGDRLESLSDADLPLVVVDPFRGDSRDVILPLVLPDQK